MEMESAKNKLGTYALSRTLTLQPNIKETLTEMSKLILNILKRVQYTRGKSLLEPWGTTFLPTDSHP